MRIRERDELSPHVLRELAALDTALSGERVEDELAELGELAVALRSERPQPRPEFAAELDAKVTTGFRPVARRAGAAGKASRYRRFTARRRAVPLALGTAATVFIAVTAVISAGGQNEHRVSGPAVPAVKEGQPAAGRSAAGSTAAAPAPLPRPSEPPATGAHKVERAAALVLSAPPGEIENVADDAIGVTDRYGGFVMSSSVSSGELEKAGASLDLRIPTSRLAAALADLSGLAHVRSRTQSADDITAKFRSPRRHLADAVAERRALLRQLAGAQTANETASIRARLRLADRRIDRARASLRRLEAQVGLARVSVSIEPGRGRDAGAWSPRDALRDAGLILSAALGALIVALAVAVPVLLATAALLVARRVYVSRARERALDAAPRG